MWFTDYIMHNLVLLAQTTTLDAANVGTKLKNGIGGIIGLILLFIFVKGIIVLNSSLEQRKEGVEGAGNGIMTAALMIAGPLIITAIFAVFWGTTLTKGINVNLDFKATP